MQPMLPQLPQEMFGWQWLPLAGAIAATTAASRPAAAHTYTGNQPTKCAMIPCAYKLAVFCTCALLVPQSICWRWHACK